MTARRLGSLAATLLLAPALLGLSLGCSNRLADSTKTTAREKDKEDPLEVAFERMRKAAGPADYRDALRQVGFALDKDEKGQAEVKQDTTELASLKDRLGLDPDEFEEAAALTFRPLDAYHVEFCFQLRDVADSLQIQGLRQPLKQAEVAFEWAVRQLLVRGGDDIIPPQFALLRGEGTSHERALLFLALLQQLDIDGCMIALPGTSADRPRYWLPGALIQEGNKAEVYLFDTRLGLPLPGPGGKGIATLAQVRSDPKLLPPLSPDEAHPYDVTFEQAKEAEAHLVWPLSALAPRMRYLEDRLASHDRVRLAVNPAKLFKRFEDATGGKVQVWNRPTGPDKLRPITPTRILREFLPADEGGLNKGQPLQGLRREFVPLAVVLKNYRDMRVYDELSVKEAQERLLKVSAQAFLQYIVTPHERLTRGRFEEATRKLVRIREAVQEFKDARLPDKVEREHAAAWRDRMKEAYLAKIRGEPGAAARLESLWNEDQYLVGLVREAEEAGPRRGEDRDPRADMKLALTFIVLGATGEPLAGSAEYLLALAEQEKAERLQNRADQGQAGARGPGASRAAESWARASSWADQYARRYPITAEVVAKRARSMLEGWRSREDVDTALGLGDQLFRDLRRSVACRLFHANGLRESGKGQQSADYLTRVSSEVDGLRASAELKAALAEFAGRANSMPPGLQRLVRFQLDALSRELGPSGGITWMGHSALLQRQLARGK